MDRAQHRLNGLGDHPSVAPTDAKMRSHVFGNATLIQDDCFTWLPRQPPNSVHAIVTDPPYGLVEYSGLEQKKLRAGKGGVWRIPPSFDGSQRSPLPRFTVLKRADLDALEQFFAAWAARILPVLVPGANVVVASNPLLSYVVSHALARCGLERRGEIVRLVMTMRGGDRPKRAHVEFPGVSVMPRSMWEPWLVFRTSRWKDAFRTISGNGVPVVFGVYPEIARSVTLLNLLRRELRSAP